jgi:glycosyltransferase involved in cell wall biosynthesis
VAKRLSIIVPAYNEAARLATTVEEILLQASPVLDAYEVIIVNDGSTDATGQVADRLAGDREAVQVIHQLVNRGVGAAYYTALYQASFEYVTLVPGDNAFHHSGLQTLFAAVGAAELVISYRTNIEARTPLRRLLSRSCNRAMRLLTGCPIRDTHSMFVFPVALARQIPENRGYGYHMEALATLLQRVDSYIEVPVRLNPKPDASSRVMRLRPLACLARTMLGLYARRLTIGLLRRWRRPVCRMMACNVVSAQEGQEELAA